MEIKTPLPFIEFECISISDPQYTKKDIITHFSKRMNNQWIQQPIWKGNEQNPIIRFEFPSYHIFLERFNREIPIFEKVIQILSNPILNRQKYGLPEGLTLIPIKQDPSDEIYLINKMTSNYKDPIRLNFEFTFKLGELFGINTFYEEIADGFLIFYKTRTDFEDAQKDKLNPGEIKNWLQAKGVWNPIIEKILSSLFKSTD
jgi:hypothetical protein